MITMPIATGYDPGNFLSRAILKIECQIGSDLGEISKQESSVLI